MEENYLFIGGPKDGQRTALPEPIARVNFPRLKGFSAGPGEPAVDYVHYRRETFRVLGDEKNPYSWKIDVYVLDSMSLQEATNLLFQNYRPEKNTSNETP